MSEQHRQTVRADGTVELLVPVVIDTGLGPGTPYPPAPPFPPGWSVEDVIAFIDRLEAARQAALEGAGTRWSRPETIQTWKGVFGVSRNRMSQMLRKREVRCEKVGGRWKIAQADLPAAERAKHSG
jgi:hypothetical protein